MSKQVTKAQFQELANDYWNKVFASELEGEALKAYKAELSKELWSYTIILPIKPAHPNQWLNELINTYCDDVRESEGRLLYTGHCRNRINMQEQFEYVSEWSTGYREIYVSEKDRAIVTFCEGDFNVSIHNSLAGYRSEIAKCELFYKEY